MKKEQSALVRSLSASCMVSGLALGLLGGTAFGAADVAPPGRSIGYVVTNIQWAVYQAKDAQGKETKAECPNGINDGAREQFATLFPPGGKKLKMAETQIAREAEIWWPTPAADQFDFHEASGPTSYGLDLDGKVKSTDFTSPDGKPGVDNQLFRAIGCILNHREGSSLVLFERNFHWSNNINRLLIELTDVDSLVNDDDVTITTYRGRDMLVWDAAGGFQAGGSQRIDTEWGQDFIHHGKGKIVNGVLVTTPPLDELVWPQQVVHNEATTYLMRGARFDLKLTPEKAVGFIAGYADVESFYRSINRRWSTHQISYGKTPSASLYKALRRLADGYPDQETGENTGISAAIDVKMTQVRILHPEKEISVIEPAPSAKQTAESTSNATAK